MTHLKKITFFVFASLTHSVHTSDTPPATPTSPSFSAENFFKPFTLNEQPINVKLPLKIEPENHSCILTMRGKNLTTKDILEEVEPLKRNTSTSSLTYTGPQLTFENFNETAQHLECTSAVLTFKNYRTSGSILKLINSTKSLVEKIVIEFQKNNQSSFVDGTIDFPNNTITDLKVLNVAAITLVFKQ